MAGLSEMIQRALAEVEARQAQLGQQQVQGAASMPIPGVTGPRGTGAAIPGLLPTPIAPPQQFPQPATPPFAPAGPFGQQAMQLAGLLGHSQIPAAPSGPTIQGGGLLGGGMNGFRIPMNRAFGK